MHTFKEGLSEENFGKVNGSLFLFAVSVLIGLGVVLIAKAFALL